MFYPASTTQSNVNNPADRDSFPDLQSTSFIGLTRNGMRTAESEAMESKFLRVRDGRVVTRWMECPERFLLSCLCVIYRRYAGWRTA
jgi:hypothetical protein